jgi:hypothetical protein
MRQNKSESGVGEASSEWAAESERVRGSEAKKKRARNVGKDASEAKPKRK